MLNDFKPEVAIIMRSDETIKEFNLKRCSCTYNLWKI